MTQSNRVSRMTLIGQMALFICIVASSALAQQYTVLYNFTGNADGDTPAGTLIRDTQGNLYGTTQYGGNGNGLAGHGTVFEYTASGELNTLYAFTGNSDGSNPFSGLVRDSQGNLYGTAPYGGTFTLDCPQGCGVIYEVTSEGETLVRHSFAGNNYGTDGLFPMGGLFLDSQGNLYGTTLYGGGGNAGTVFKLIDDFSFVTLYAFEGGRDGVYPYAGVTMDNLSNIYGTTYFGGEVGPSVNHRDNGTAFEIIQAESSKRSTDFRADWTRQIHRPLSNVESARRLCSDDSGRRLTIRLERRLRTVFQMTPTARKNPVTIYGNT